MHFGPCRKLNRWLITFVLNHSKLKIDDAPLYSVSVECDALMFTYNAFTNKYVCSLGTLPFFSASAIL